MPFSFALLISVAVYDMILDYSSNKYNSGDKNIRKIYFRLVVVSQASKSSHVPWVSTSYSKITPQ